MGFIGKVLGVWRAVDDRLHRLSLALRKVVRALRIARFLLLVGILAVLASAVVGLFWPAWFPVAYAVATIFLVVPLIGFLVLVALPLRARRVVSWVDAGYPANTRAAAAQAAAARLHEASMGTEDLLIETLANESRKILERRRAKAREAREASAAHAEVRA